MMSVRRRYGNPPVVEALAELYFEGSNWDLTVPGSFYEQVKAQFPKKGQADLLEIQLQIGQGGAQTRMASPESRVVFRNDDESRLVQVGRDVLVVNQLHPYPHFEAWSRVLLDMLAVYRQVAQPTATAKLGMRYINRIEIEVAHALIEEYFNVYPAIPKEIGEWHGDFLVRLQLPTRVTGHELLLTFGKTTPELPGNQAFLLDLYDVIPLGGLASFDMIEEHLRDAHENIEWVFEHTITDATRAVFGEVPDDLR